MMLIKVINKGSEPCCGSNDKNSTGVSLSDILFSFMLEKYIVCNVFGLRSPSCESSGVLYITPTYTTFKKVHVEWNYILQPPKYLIIVVTNRFQYINNNVIKVRCSIYIDI